MKASYIEDINILNLQQLSNVKGNIYVEKNCDDKGHWGKGTKIWYKKGPQYILYSLEDEYDALVWKSPDAFIDSIIDFIEEDVAINGRSSSTNN